MTNTATLTSYSPTPDKQTWAQQFYQSQATLADLRQDISMQRLKEINRKLDQIEDSDSQ